MPLAFVPNLLTSMIPYLAIPKYPQQPYPVVQIGQKHCMPRMHSNHQDHINLASCSLSTRHCQVFAFTQSPLTLDAQRKPMEPWNLPAHIQCGLCTRHTQSFGMFFHKVILKGQQDFVQRSQTGACSPEVAKNRNLVSNCHRLRNSFPKHLQSQNSGKSRKKTSTFQQRSRQEA